MTNSPRETAIEPARLGGGRREGLVRGIVITALFLSVSRVFGLLRELIVAARIGPSENTDAVYLVLTFVSTVTTIIAMVAPNAVAHAFYRHEARPGYHAEIWGAVAGWSALLGVVAIAVTFGASPLADILADQRSAAFHTGLVHALRVGAVALWLQGIVLLMMAICNAERWHTPVALVSTGMPIGSVLGVLALERRLGAESVIWGLVLASAIQVGMMFVVLVRNGLAPHRFSGRAMWTSTHRALAAAAPVFLGATLLKLDMPIKARLASSVAAGQVFVFALAAMVVNVPMSVANSAVGQPGMPELVRAHAQHSTSQFSAVYQRISEAAMLLVLPFAVMFVVEAHDIVTLLFLRGRFGLDSVDTAAATVRIWGGASWFLVHAVCVEDALTACEGQRLAAAERGVFVVAMSLLAWLGAGMFQLPGILGGFVVACALRYVVVTELLAWRAEMTRWQAWCSTARVVVLFAIVCALSGIASVAIHATGAPLLARLAVVGAVCVSTAAAGARLIGFVVADSAWTRIRAQFEQWGARK